MHRLRSLQLFSLVCFHSLERLWCSNSKRGHIQVRLEAGTWELPHSGPYTKLHEVMQAAGLVPWQSCVCAKPSSQVLPKCLVYIFFRPWDQVKRRKGGAMVWRWERGYKREMLLVIRKKKSLSCSPSRKGHPGLEVLLVPWGQVRLERVCWGYVMAVALTVRPTDLILSWGPQSQDCFHNNSKILWLFLLSFWVYDGLFQDYVTWNITADQMKMRIQWSSIKPDTEEIWKMYNV